MEILKGTNKFYIGETEENFIAEITYKYHSEDVIIIDHTYVDPLLRGQNVAGRLLASIVEMARKENLKVIPVCSYAVLKLTRNNQYEDILYKK
jgi:predicted GNAT family acetyltransferase